MARWISTWIFGLGIFLVGSAAWGGGADPEGTMPFGIITASETRGPKLVGVLVAEFVGVGGGSDASSARLTLRLRRGSQLEAMFATLGPLDTEDTPGVQEDILEAFEEQVKKAFFADVCGTSGTECPSADLLLKQIDEFATTDDGGDGLITVSDVVLAMDEPL
jgi:hypothetical protein